MDIQNKPVFHHQIHKHELTIKKYNEACCWLQDLGIDFRPTRFKNYIEQSQLIFGKNAKDIDQYKSDIEFREAVDAFLNANREIHELLRIVEGLRKIENEQEFIEQLRKTASGSTLQTINPKDYSRNFAFELDIASRFIYAGYKVNLSKIADIEVDIDGVTLYVECKRITSPGQLRKRVKSANSQLVSRLRRDLSSHSRGLTAVEVSHLVGLNPDIYGYKSAEIAYNAASETINQFVRENEPELKVSSKKRLVGILAQISFPTFIVCESDFAAMTARASTILTYDKTESDSMFIETFWKKLGDQVDYLTN